MPEERNGNGSRQLLYWLLGVLFSISILLGGAFIANNSDRLAKIEAELKERTLDRYTATTARGDFAARDSRIDSHSSTLADHEKRLLGLELRRR